MAKQLFIRFQQNPEDHEWVFVEDSAVTSSGVFSNTEHDIETMANHCTVILLVPTLDVLLTQLNKYPKTSSAKLLKAVPFALEEQLYQDINELHFAIGTPTRAGQLPVAVVAQQAMLQWREWFEQTLPGLAEAIKAITPDVFAIPFAVQTWSIMLEEHSALIRTGECAGFAVDRSHLTTVIPALLSALSEDEQPINIHIYRFTESSEDWYGLFPERNVVEEKIADATLAWLSLNFKEQTGINLLQGRYRSNKKLTALKKNSVIAGIIAAVGLSISLLGNAAQYADINSQETKVQASIADIYHTVFPNATDVIAPKYRFEKELTMLMRAQHRVGFLKIMDIVSPVFKKSSGIDLQNLQYQNNELTVDLNATGLTQLDTLIKDLNQHGLQTKQNKINTDEKGVHAHLVIVGGAS